mmetsp:Transcript_39628/g.60678  ORF Transcript_39628/g.60678 Transcript_39628/m.60678 type:complete len:221 (-) Transcript_39628:23-685(-)
MKRGPNNCVLLACRLACTDSESVPLPESDHEQVKHLDAFFVKRQIARSISSRVRHTVRLNTIREFITELKCLISLISWEAILLHPPLQSSIGHPSTILTVNCRAHSALQVVSVARVNLALEAGLVIGVDTFAIRKNDRFIIVRFQLLRRQAKDFTLGVHELLHEVVVHFGWVLLIRILFKVFEDLTHTDAALVKVFPFRSSVLGANSQVKLERSDFSPFG